MKRFTATEKWANPWFQQLSPPMKCLWLYLCDNCDAAGVWVPNFPLASFIIRSKVTRESLAGFGGRVVELSSGRLWIEAFIPFQYVKLRPECRPHLRVLELLRTHGIEYRDDQCFPGGAISKGILPSQDRVCHTVSDRVSHTLEEEEEDKEQSEDKGRIGSRDGDKVETKGVSPKPPFSQFWEAYPKKAAKAFAETAWKKGRCDALLPKILEAISRAKATEAWTKEHGQFIPHPATWLKGRYWEDETPPASTRGGGVSSAANSAPDPAEWSEFLQSAKGPSDYDYETAPDFLRTDFRQWKTTRNL